MPTGQSSVDSSSLRLSSRVTLDCVKLTVKFTPNQSTEPGRQGMAFDLLTKGDGCCCLMELVLALQDDTISINHNWVNGCNLANMWHFLQEELRAVQREVGEWKDSMPDWHHHCQVIMKSCTGINFEEFYHFLKVIAEKRLLILGQGLKQDREDSTDLQQAAFDVGRLADVLASVVTHPDFQRVDTSAFSPQPEELLQQLKHTVTAAEAH